MSDVQVGQFKVNPPLIKPSGLTSKEKGGVGKELSTGWNLNFSIGCFHGCGFCYVPATQKRFGPQRYGPLLNLPWGDYLLTPSNLPEAIAKTNWKQWKGEEAMLSSTHDAWLPQLVMPDYAGKKVSMARTILEAALPQGVRFCIQTRSLLVLNDLDLLVRYKSQIRLQVSIATMNIPLARRIEPRVPTPQRRLEVLRKAKEAGLSIGVIIAPIFPPSKWRPEVLPDLYEMAKALGELRPQFIYGESLHRRGSNMTLVKQALEDEAFHVPQGFDFKAQQDFDSALAGYGLRGVWWPE